MGADNSGVLYALWSYQGQAADELGFNEGDMVTILQKAQGVDWWWASLCGREGFVPNNYFGLFPKVRPLGSRIRGRRSHLVFCTMSLHQGEPGS
ncbi:unnamed protein product [Arctogadus glacialis]